MRRRHAFFAATTLAVASVVAAQADAQPRPQPAPAPPPTFAPAPVPVAPAPVAPAPVAPAPISPAPVAPAPVAPQAAPMGASVAPPQTAASVDSGVNPTADKGSGPELVPTDDKSRALWYRPTKGEIHKPRRPRFVPLGVIWSPQGLVSGGRGGTFSTVTLNIPVLEWFSFDLGAQVADALRFYGGFDLFRYAGVEVPIAAGQVAVSAVIAPTIGIHGYVNGSAAGGDVGLSPFGIRTIFSSISSMAELRFTGHTLFGAELSSFGGGSNEFVKPSPAVSLGAEIVLSPLFWRRGGDEPIRKKPAEEEEESPKKKKTEEDEEARRSPLPGTLSAGEHRGGGL